MQATYLYFRVIPVIETGNRHLEIATPEKPDLQVPVSGSKNIGAACCQIGYYPK
ncbi:hypothetical protein LJC71_03175 [Desulfosarcina sp. OttesenSCG-928-A07]|nr:hypothetical protein [Desulfosarcina sp. OttesenSCG-928-A07]